MTMMFSLLERRREKAGESERDEGEIANEKKGKGKTWKRGQYEKEREIERERVVSRGLTYVNVFPAGVLAAEESWVNLGDRSKWSELVTSKDTGEGSSRWIAQPAHGTKHTHTKPHYNEDSSRPQKAHTSQSSKSH